MGRRKKGCNSLNRNRISEAEVGFFSKHEPVHSPLQHEET